MRSNHPLSRIEYQVMWNRLISVVEEQAQTLVRTAFGTATREAGDLSAGVYDTQGRMLAQAVTGTPGHVNSMAMSVGHVLAKVPLAKMNDGDAFIVNDPWQGTGHLNDIVIVTPTFRRGSAVGLFACTLHVVDIGGRGIMGAAQQVYEEGLYLPITKIVDKGEMNQWLIDIIVANVREPVQVIGDIYSEISSNEVGGKRLIAMMDEFGLEHLDDLGKHILDHSREASLAAINRLPHGTYHNSMMVDGINGKSMEIKAKLTIGPDGIDVDFAGSPGMVQLGINVPLCYTEAYTSFGVKCIVAPRVPNNAASLATIRVTAPEGCILNAKHPAPVAARSIIGQMLPDVVFGCLQQALPDGVPAEGTSCLWNVRLMGGMGRVDGDPAAAAEGHALQRHVVPFRRHRRAAQARRPVGHGVPERRAQRAGRDHRDHCAGAGVVQGIPHRFGRRRRVSRRAGPDHGGRERRGHAVRHLDQLRPRRLPAARPRRRQVRHDRPGRAGLRQDPGAQGAFLDPGRRAPAGQHARRRRLRRSAQAPGGEGGRRRGARPGVGREGA